MFIFFGRQNKMEKRLFKRGLVIGIIILFVGAGITTAVSAISIKNDGREAHVLKEEVGRLAEGTKGKGAESGLIHVLVDSSIDGDVSLGETEEVYDTSKLNGNDEYLIKTSWGQTGLYAMKTPLKRPWGFRLNPLNHWRLGCWSTAIGQIINYHYQIQSQGKVHYQCSEIVDRFGRKVVIDNDLDDHMYDWSKMPNKLTIFSKPKEINSVSTFLYDVSTVIQKDFGTYYYVLAEGWDMVYELADHFDKINSNSEWAVNPPVSEIENEIDNYRPCMLYMENKNGTRGHAVIIDGYEWEADNFIVHLNFG